MPPKKDTTTPQVFQSMLASGKIPRVILMEGVEENLKDEAMTLLRRTVLEPGFEQLNEITLENPPYDELVAACETMPFMAERRLIIVRDQDGFVSRGDGDPRLQDYLPHVPETAVLVFFVREAVNKTRSLCKKIKACGVIVTCDRMDARSLGAWVQQRFAEAGKKCSMQTASRLVFVSGTDTGVLSTEIAKLTALAGERDTVTDADVDAAAVRSTECRVFDLTDALVNQQNARALRLMQDMLLTGESRAGILSMLLRQFRLMQHLKIMKYEKVPDEQLQTAMKLSPYQLELLQRQAKNYNGSQVRRGVDICLETEYAFKSGRISEEGSLEAALLKLIALKAT